MQEHNDLKHTINFTSEKKVVEWLHQSQSSFRRMTLNRKPFNVAEVEQFWKKEWAKIPLQLCERLIASYYKCLIAVLAAKGGTTSYSV